MEKQISIIIPTYNMEKYIGKCLDSLLIPEFDKVEVIVVNDGSKDRSSEIAHSYADRYPDSIRVIDKPNGNYGSCINTALPLCSGRYVKILDADDTFDSEAFSEFTKALSTYNSDVILTTFSRINQDGKEYMKVGFNIDNLTIDKEYSIKDSFNNLSHKLMQMHSICYKLSIFRKFAYYQIEGISYTDTIWSIIPLCHCESVIFSDIKLYRYSVGRNGATTQPDQVLKSATHFFKIAKYLIEKYKSFIGNETQSKLLYSQISQYHRTFYRQLMSCVNEDIAGLMKSHDEFIKYSSLEGIYSFLNTTPYSDELNFHIIEDFRRKNYPIDYNVPIRVKLIQVLKFKFKQIFCQGI